MKITFIVQSSHHIITFMLDADFYFDILLWSIVSAFTLLWVYGWSRFNELLISSLNVPQFCAISKGFLQHDRTEIWLLMSRFEWWRQDGGSLDQLQMLYSLTPSSSSSSPAHRPTPVTIKCPCLQRSVLLIFLSSGPQIWDLCQILCSAFPPQMNGDWGCQSSLLLCSTEERMLHEGE